MGKLHEELMNKIAMVLASVLLTGASMPPPEYDYPPTVPVNVVELSTAQIQYYCKGAKLEASAVGNVAACTLLKDGVCTIYWPYWKYRMGVMWIHEMAHCNGWRH